MLIATPAIGLALALALAATRLRMPPLAGHLLTGIVLMPHTPVGLRRRIWRHSWRRLAVMLLNVWCRHGESRRLRRELRTALLVAVALAQIAEFSFILAVMELA
jgi:predicted Kef-type K+ transport protein